MASHELTRTQRNEVLQAIQDVGLNHDDFFWREVRSEFTGRPMFTVEEVVHRPTNYRFRFDVDEDRGHHFANSVPGPEGPEFHINAGSWRNELVYAKQWVQGVKDEIEAIDL